MAGRIERHPGFAPGIDTLYVYENEDDIIPSVIAHTLSTKDDGKKKDAQTPKEAALSKMHEND